jgi:hypothetical protein
MFSTTIDLTLKELDDNLDRDGKLVEKEKVVQVILQEVSPFIVDDVLADSMTQKGTINMGAFVKGMIGKAIISPKNIAEQIEKASNGFDALSTLFNELNRFCTEPKRYVLLQKQSEISKSNVGDSPAQSDVDGDKAAK